MNTLDTLPKAKIKDIREAGRTIAHAIFPNDQQKIDFIHSRIRAVMSLEATTSVSESDRQELLELITQKRDAILVLLAEKECIGAVAGKSKKDASAREELARDVLDEVITKISEYNTN